MDQHPLGMYLTIPDVSVPISCEPAYTTHCLLFVYLRHMPARGRERVARQAYMDVHARAALY